MYSKLLRLDKSSIKFSIWWILWNVSVGRKNNWNMALVLVSFHRIKPPLCAIIDSISVFICPYTLISANKIKPADVCKFNWKTKFFSFSLNQPSLRCGLIFVLNTWLPGKSPNSMQIKSDGIIDLCLFIVGIFHFPNLNMINYRVKDSSFHFHKIINIAPNGFHL